MGLKFIGGAGVWLLLAVGGCGMEHGSAVLPVAEASAAAVRADDYLSPELRERVEALKRDVATEPSNERNARERALVLFDWVNAYARAGGYVPVELTALVARVTSYRMAAGPELDAFIRELTLRDERPDAIGTLTTESGPFEVAQPATFRQVYTVGSEPLRTGGMVLVAKHFQANHPPFQVDDPAGDNYVAVTASRDGVEFAPERIAIAGMHGGFRGAEGQLGFRIVAGTLEPGDTVTVTYGDTTGGGRGLVMPDFVSDAMPFPIYVDPDGSGVLLSVPLEPVVVTAGPIAGVHGFAPSVVGVDEPFELSIRAEDAFGNRARGPIPAWRLELDGQVVREIPAGEDGVVVVDGLRLGTPGIARFSISSTDGKFAGRVNPVRVETEPQTRIFWGDTHGHSGFAEGIGSADAFMRFARDDARLDFVTHSEHDLWMDDGEWEQLRDKVQRYTEDGRFIAYLGYEWTTNNTQGGHHNVLFRRPEGRSRTPTQLYPTLSKLYQGLRTANDPNDVVVIPHAHQRGDYRLSDPELQPLVEIMSMHGTFEWFGRMYLNHGHRVGFIAASDDHLGRPGYAAPNTTSLAQRGGLGAVFAPERTVDAIFDGMRNLQAYATSGDRILLDVAVNGTAMGQRAELAPERVVKGRVAGTAPIDSITVVKNDAEVWSRSYRPAGPARGTVNAVLSFFSESHPFHQPDNPRGWRHWRGTVEVRGASVRAAHLVDRVNHRVQYLERDPTRPGVVRFATLTRGDLSSIDLGLEGVGRNTEIIVQLDDADETGSGPPILRRHQTIAGQTVVLPMREVVDGYLVRDVPFDGYADRIVLRTLSGEGPLDVDFEFVDTSTPQHGDYYFVRVRQANEALAWSSPIWVGGFPPR